MRRRCKWCRKVSQEPGQKRVSCAGWRHVKRWRQTNAANLLGVRRIQLAEACLAQRRPTASRSTALSKALCPGAIFSVRAGMYGTMDPRDKAWDDKTA